VEFQLCLSFKAVTSLNLRRKLCSLNNQGLQEVWLCQECKMTLSHTTEAMHWGYNWPSYFWKLLSQNLEVIVTKFKYK